MGRLQQFKVELKRRRVFRALLGWALASFAVLQVVEPVLHALHLPDWTLTAVVVALALGFPATVVLAWFFDLTRAGITRTADAAPREDGAGPPSRRRLAFSLAGIVALSAALGAGLAVAVLRRAPPPSVAVLPFVNLSSDKDQEFFADGIAEEILDALARIEGLKVIGRTSSFSFKGKGEDLRTIAAKLDVATLLEGSVRKAGDRVRVTAQLVRASDGSHLWSQSFDRDLADVFAVQEEVARHVVAALRARLAAAPSPAVAGGTTHWEANQHFLRGRDFGRAISVPNMRRAEAEYERAVALDPSFGLAWAGLANALRALDSMDPPSASARQRERAAFAAGKAIALAPGLPEGYVARGRIRRGFEHDWNGAHDDFQRAYALAPGDARAVAYAGADWVMMGDPAKAISLNTRATELDPLWTWAWTLLGHAYLFSGQAAAARESYSRAIELAPHHEHPRLGLCEALLAEGRPAEALKAVEGTKDPYIHHTCSSMARHDLGQAAESQAELEALVAERGDLEAYAIAACHAWRGETDRAFAWLERARASPSGGMDWIVTDPAMRSLRGDPRWKPLLRGLNLTVE